MRLCATSIFSLKKVSYGADLWGCCLNSGLKAPVLSSSLLLFHFWGFSESIATLPTSEYGAALCRSRSGSVISHAFLCVSAKVFHSAQTYHRRRIKDPPLRTLYQIVKVKTEHHRLLRKYKIPLGVLLDYLSNLAKKFKNVFCTEHMAVKTLLLMRRWFIAQISQKYCVYKRTVQNTQWRIITRAKNAGFCILSHYEVRLCRT